MSRTLLLLVYAASLAAAATAASPPCHAPWGNEQALESPCFATVFQQGDVSVRRYAPRGANYAQAFVQASFPGGGASNKQGRFSAAESPVDAALVLPLLRLAALGSSSAAGSEQPLLFG